MSTSPAPETAARTSAAARDAEPSGGDSSPIDRVKAWNWPLLLLVGLCAMTVLGAVVYPTYSELRLGLHAALGP